MRITQREITALLRLFGNGSLKTKLAALVVVISAVLGLFYTGTAGGQGVIEGRVVSVADGDTLTVLALGNSPEKIRFAFIDAPEKAQPHGQAAPGRQQQHYDERRSPDVLTVNHARCCAGRIATDPPAPTASGG